MKYRKLGRETRIRRSILAGLTKDVIMNGYVENIMPEYIDGGLLWLMQ